MGELITEALHENLSYINQKSFNKLLRLKIEANLKTTLFSDMCRFNILYMIAKAGSGHIGSSFSSIDIFSYLFLNEKNKDDIVFSSKGHDAPAYYSVLIGTGKIESSYLHKLRRLGGLPGHPDIKIPGVITNTGSLGMGISKAKGMILANRLNKKKNRIFVITGDGELQEGQFWESLISAANLNLDELTVIVDHNKLQSDTFLKNVSDLGDLNKKFESFGWHVERCNGNNYSSIKKTFKKLEFILKPKIIIADTIKGCGVSFMEHTSLDSDNDMYRFHSGAPDSDSYHKASKLLLDRINCSLKKIKNFKIDFEYLKKDNYSSSSEDLDKLIPSYGKFLVREAKKNKKLVALDADLVLDTGLIPFKETFPDKFFECGIAEQDMVSIAGGLALNNYLPIVHSFACFLTSRPIEQIYNNSTELKKIIYVGSLAGVLPAGPGHSHQAIRDILTMSSIPNLIIIEPSSSDELDRIFDWAVNKTKKSIYLRLASIPFKKTYEYKHSSKVFPGRGVSITNSSSKTIITYGPYMLEIALEIRNILKNKNLNIEVINFPWLNMIDEKWFCKYFEKKEVIFILENQYHEAGIAGLFAKTILKNNQLNHLKLKYFGVEKIPSSGTNHEVLDDLNLSSNKLSKKIIHYLKNV